MSRDKKKNSRGDQRTSVGPENKSPLNVQVEELPPETAEDFLLLAIEKSDLSEIVKILRDWHGSKAIRRAIDRLHHRDPVDRFTHIHRHAVEIYATSHQITPANLMVELTGKGDRKNAEGSERHSLQKAREFVKEDKNALMAARALADWWEEERPKGMDATDHLKILNRKISILSTKPPAEV